MSNHEVAVASDAEWEVKSSFAFLRRFGIIQVRYFAVWWTKMCPRDKYVTQRILKDTKMGKKILNRTKMAGG